MPTSARDSEPSTSASLLRHAQDGDAESWRMLAQLYGPIVYAWARCCGCQAADAADVMQETFTAVAQALPRFDAEAPRRNFRGWLWTITRNKLRDRARSQQDPIGRGGTSANLYLQQVADRALENPPSEQSSDSAALRSRALVLLKDQFDPRSWRMFWETEIHGRLPADVAEEMQVSRWAVYKARARVLQRLKEQLKDLP